MEEKITTKKMIAAIALSLLMLIVTQLISQGFASLLYALGVPSFICNAVAGMLYIGLSYIAAKFLCSKILKYQTSEFYITKPKVHCKWVVIGILLPLIVCSVYLLFRGNFVSSGKETGEIVAMITAAIFFYRLRRGNCRGNCVSRVYHACFIYEIQSNGCNHRTFFAVWRCPYDWNGF